MKRIIVTVFAILFCMLPFSKKTVIASSECYYRILKENVFIYADSNLEKPMFIVPYTYYVKAENINGNVVRVVYGDDQADYPVIIG